MRQNIPGRGGQEVLRRVGVDAPGQRRRVGRTDPAGRFVAPSVPGVYLVGGARLVVQ